MFWVTVSVIITFVTGSLGCSLTEKDARTGLTENQSSKMLNPDESRVYSTVIDAFRNNYGSQRLLIINETTMGIVSPKSTPDDVVQFLRKRLPNGITPEVVDDFKKRNEQPVKLRDEFVTRVSYLLVEKQDSKLRGDWDEFSKNNPGSAILQLSRIGFNSGVSQALVYLSSDVGSRSGWGYYVFLVKRDQDWQVQSKQLAWAS